jgi:hypothetical protein
VVQTLRAGGAVLERRDAVLEQLVDVVDEGRHEGARAAGCSRLTAEGLVGAVLSIVHGRLVRGEPSALVGLTGELAGMVVLPYLGAAAARREQQRRAPVVNGHRNADSHRSAESRGADPLEGVEMRLTYRTVRILEGAHEHPGASNRRLAEMAGIQDQGQASKLLARLRRLGLLSNRSLGHAKGEPNAWSLTTKGAQVVQSLGAQRGIVIAGRQQEELEG